MVRSFAGNILFKKFLNYAMWLYILNTVTLKLIYNETNVYFMFSINIYAVFKTNIYFLMN
jgi:hypothetical protein